MPQSAQASSLKVLVSKEWTEKNPTYKSRALLKLVGGKRCSEIMASDKSNTNMMLHLSRYLCAILGN